MTGMFSASIVRHHVIEVDDPKKGVPKPSHVNFDVCVTVTLPGSGEHQKHTVTKRFSDFHKLQTELKRTFRSGLPSLPPKTVKKSFSGEFIAKRVEKLNAFLRPACALRYLSNHVPFRAFFDIPQKFPELQPPAVIKLAAFAEKVEVHFEQSVENESAGVRFAVFDSCVVDSRTVVTACGDASAVSRMDTFLNKFRLPWEPKIKTLYNGSLNVWLTGRLTSDAGESPVVKHATVSVSNVCTAVAFCPTTRKIFVGTHRGEVLVYLLQATDLKLKYVAKLPAKHKDRITCFHIDPDNSRIFCAGHDKTVSIFSTHNYAWLGSASVGESYVTSMTVVAKAKRMFIGTFGRLIFELDISDIMSAPKIVTSYSAHDGSVRCLSFNEDMQHLYSGGFDNQLCIWKKKAIPSDGSESASYSLELGAKVKNPCTDLKLKSLCWCESLGYLVTGGDTGFLHVWKVSPGGPDATCVLTFRASQKDVVRLHWLHKQQILVSCAFDGRLSFWSIDFEAKQATQVAAQEEEAETQAFVDSICQSDPETEEEEDSTQQSVQESESVQDLREDVTQLAVNQQSPKSTNDQDGDEPSKVSVQDEVTSKNTVTFQEPSSVFDEEAPPMTAKQSENLSKLFGEDADQSPDDHIFG